MNKGIEQLIASEEKVQDSSVKIMAEYLAQSTEYLENFVEFKD